MTNFQDILNRYLPMATNCEKTTVELLVRHDEYTNFREICNNFCIKQYLSFEISINIETGVTIVQFIRKDKQ